MITIFPFFPRTSICNSELSLSPPCTIMHMDVSGVHVIHSAKDKTANMNNISTLIQYLVCFYLCQLGLVESGPGLQLVVSLVASQRVHLQLEKVNLKTQHRAHLDLAFKCVSSVHIEIRQFCPTQTTNKTTTTKNVL